MLSKNNIYIDKCSSIIMQKMHTHAHTPHTHTVQTDGSEGLSEIFCTLGYQI